MYVFRTPDGTQMPKTDHHNFTTVNQSVLVLFHVCEKSLARATDSNDVTQIIFHLQMLLLIPFPCVCARALLSQRWYLLTCKRSVVDIEVLFSFLGIDQWMANYLFFSAVKNEVGDVLPNLYFQKILNLNSVTGIAQVLSLHLIEVKKKGVSWSVESTKWTSTNQVLIISECLFWWRITYFHMTSVLMLMYKLKEADLLCQQQKCGDFTLDHHLVKMH